MKNKAIIRSGWLMTCLCFGLVQASVAQTDPHFTQSYTFPMYINPALTGSSDGAYRVSTVYRSQWGSMSRAYRTIGASFDARTNKNFALGVNLLNQSGGNGAFNYLSAYVSYAYTGVKFGQEGNQHIVLAMQAGILNRRVDPGKFTWGDQWNPITGYSSSNPTTEIFARTSATTLDMGAGALYFDATPDKKTNAFGGVSIFHINKPKDPFVSNQSTELNIIPFRYTLHGGFSFNLSERTSIVPHIMYMRQGSAYEAMIGVYGQINVNEDTDFMLGGYYRVKDAIAPFFGIDYKNLIIGVSYDANISRLSQMAGNVNSFELSLSYVKRGSTRTIFDFLRCARL